MQVGEFGVEDPHVLTGEDQYVPGCEGKEAEDLLGGRPVARALFRVDAELSHASPLHTLSQLALDEGLDEQREEVDEEERLDAGLVLEEDRGEFEDALELLEALLDGRLSAVGRAEAAGLFYYLNRTGYNGLCRFNSKGGFNVPFGTYKTINYRTEFPEYKGAFKRWMFTCMDFEQLELEPADFIYADPPYDVEFTQYSKGGFGWGEQERAAEWLAKHKGPVVLSNQATPRIVKLYRALKFNLKFLEAPRRISCNGDRTPAPEVLAYRNIK